MNTKEKNEFHELMMGIVDKIKKHEIKQKKYKKINLGVDKFGNDIAELFGINELINK
jgi:hypothetical protein